MGFTSGFNRIFLKFSIEIVRAAEGLQSESVGRGPYPIMLVRTASAAQRGVNSVSRIRGKMESCRTIEKGAE